jgi:hypothetical protein
MLGLLSKDHPARMVDEPVGAISKVKMEWFMLIYQNQ